MARGVAVWMGCAVLLLAGTSARAEHMLSEDDLRSEMAGNRALAGYVERNGTPDAAESRFLTDRPPWDEHEVVLYYLDRRLEISFARAFILGKPEVQVVRSERPMTDAQVAAMASRQQHPSAGGRQGEREARPGGVRGPTERAEDAARRAEDAANRIEAAVPGVERAADRAEAVVSRMARSSRN